MDFSRIVRSLMYHMSKPYRIYRRHKFLSFEKSGKAITCHFSTGFDIRLFAKGQIAECLYMHSYEYDEIELVINHVKAGMNVIDIGANIGLYSIISDRLVGVEGHVWAFEPSTETHNRLLANLALNEASSVEPIKIALSDVVDSELTLKRDPGHMDG